MTYSFKLIKAHHIISHQTRTFLNFTCFHQHTCPHSIFSRGSSSPLEHTSKLNERKNMPENYSNDLLFYCLRTVALLQALSFREYLWYSFFFFSLTLWPVTLEKYKWSREWSSRFVIVLHPFAVISVLFLLFWPRFVLFLHLFVVVFGSFCSRFVSLCSHFTSL